MNPRTLILTALTAALLAGCASPYLSGRTPAGEKVYIGSTDIRSTEAYQEFMRSGRTELDKERYLFKRVTEAKDLKYHRDGNTYGWVEAYRAGNWLMRNHYDKEADARSFIRDHVWKSAATGRPHLVEFPDGSIHVGYYVLLNELDLLEETAAAES